MAFRMVNDQGKLNNLADQVPVNSKNYTKIQAILNSHRGAMINLVNIIEKLKVNQKEERIALLNRELDKVQQIAMIPPAIVPMHVPVDYYMPQKSKRKQVLSDRYNDRYKMASDEEIKTLKKHYTTEEEEKNKLLNSLKISPNIATKPKIVTKLKNLTDTEVSVKSKLHKIKWKKKGLSSLPKVRGVARVIFAFMILYSIAKKKPALMTEGQKKKLQSNIDLCGEITKKWLINSMKDVIATVLYLIKVVHK